MLNKYSKHFIDSIVKPWRRSQSQPSEITYRGMILITYVWVFLKNFNELEITSMLAEFFKVNCRQ
jgi:hypothetical protein